MNNSTDQRFNHVISSIHLLNQTLSELHHISKPNLSSTEIELVNDPPFKFYRVTLQYCMVLEYTKLLDRGGNSEKHISSLFKLNKIVTKELGDSFSQKSEMNLTSINKLENSALAEKMKTLRNKTYAHNENNPVNDPFSVKGFDYSTIQDIHNQLSTIVEIVNRCRSTSELFIQPLEPASLTGNFIESHVNYKEFYFNDYKKAKLFTLEKRKTTSPPL